MEILAVIVGVIMFFMFLMVCINIGTIRKNIQSIYIFEHLRAVREGLVDKDNKVIIKKKVSTSEPISEEAKATETP